jgi:hypothetical protein
MTRFFRIGRGRLLQLARRLKDHVKDSPLGIVTGDDDLYRLTDFEQVSVIPTELDFDLPGSGALGSNSCRGHCPRLGGSFAPDNGSQSQHRDSSYQRGSGNDGASPCVS